MNISTKPVKIFTVSELNSNVRTLLEDALPMLWISGEVSNLHVQGTSGHMYFSLKDNKAQIRCAMFRSYNNQVSFKLQNGMQVVVQAQVSLYEARGDYQLIVYGIEQAGTGLLQQKFLALKEKLQHEGLFAAEHKKTLPAIPYCIGVITSPTGAAIRDILSVLQRRCAFVPIIIYPTQVQGNEAAGQIVKALTIANNRAECDVLIVTRGGGSLEDLWPFNEEIVARAIFASTIPVVSAIGHEIDFTIADFVADLRAPTPSAAAELVVPNMLEKYKTIKHQYNRLLFLMQNKLQHWQLLFTSIQRRLQHPKHRLQQQAQKLDELERRLLTTWRNKLHFLQHKLTKATSVLSAISPLATLQRGYAIARHNGHILSNVSSIKNGDIVNVLLAEGEIECSVVSINDGDLC